MGSVIGASFGGALAVTGTSGPGIALKGEAMGLAMMLELPMVIINVQRGGPSTGLPTKVEQSDLLQVLYGRNGESPIPVLAPQSPTDAFDIAYEACRLAVHAMTPVVILSDGYLANSSEPWFIPNPDDIPEIPLVIRTAERVKKRIRHSSLIYGMKRHWHGHGRFLARKGWSIALVVCLKHHYWQCILRSRTPAQMVRERAEKVARLANVIPELAVDGPDEGDLLGCFLGWYVWCGSHGRSQSARQQGMKYPMRILRYLNPFPKNTEAVLRNFKRILIPELNMGQLAFVLRGTYGLDNIITYPKMHGRPFKISEIYDKLEELLG